MCFIVIFLLFLYCGLTEWFVIAAKLCLIEPFSNFAVRYVLFYLPVLHGYKKKSCLTFYQCIFLVLTIASTPGAAVFPLAVFFFSSYSADTPILLCPWWCICFTRHLFIFTSDREGLYLFLERVPYPLNPNVPSPRSKLIWSTSILLLSFSYLRGIRPSAGIYGCEEKNKVRSWIPAELPVYPLSL